MVGTLLVTALQAVLVDVLCQVPVARLGLLHLVTTLVVAELVAVLGVVVAHVALTSSLKEGLYLPAVLVVEAVDMELPVEPQ
jgi:hypothetical protein